MLKAPAGTTGSLAELKGKVVVLEFWATWCAPCIPGLDHLSRIAAKYNHKPVQFIYITDEDEQRASWFLQKRSPTGWIGLGEKRQTIEAYRFVRLLHTVIIDPDGKIAALTLPKHVTETALDDLLAGKKISLPPKQGKAEDLEWDKALVKEHTLFQIIIQSSNAYTGGMYKPRPGHLTFDGVPLQTLLQTAFQTFEVAK
ncbi:MAG TPA: TlpA disulfide reductase family protein [Pyrinomonadaceae bacterium]|nr:TlpA disulfide reductase family protein [Pyrinomonadaceae bacterium]